MVISLFLDCILCCGIFHSRGSSRTDPFFHNAGTRQQTEFYKAGKKLTNVVLEILNLQRKEDLTIDLASNQDFNEVIFYMLAPDFVTHEACVWNHMYEFGGLWGDMLPNPFVHGRVKCTCCWVLGTTNFVVPSLRFVSWCIFRHTLQISFRNWFVMNL